MLKLRAPAIAMWASHKKTTNRGPAPPAFGPGLTNVDDAVGVLRCDIDLGVVVNALAVTHLGPSIPMGSISLVQQWSNLG